MVKKPTGSRSSKAPSRTSTSSSKPTTAGTKAATAATTAVDRGAEDQATTADAIKSQQRLLDVFSNTFRDVLSADDFSSVLQQVKQALFNRDFDAAFGNETFLSAYAARWSPPRALCYARILDQISEFLEPLLREQVTVASSTTAISTRDTSDPGPLHAAVQEPVEPLDDEIELGRVSPTVDFELEERRRIEEKATVAAAAAATAANESEEAQNEGENLKTGPSALPTLKVLSIGGAAAELAALGSYLRRSGPNVAGALTLVDTGPWGAVVSKLHGGLTTAPRLSKYASAGALASNGALVSPGSRLRYAFAQRDALSLSAGEIAGLAGSGGGGPPVLVTMLFALNELYTGGGVRRTTGFLRALGAGVAPGSLLLVVDSPGSYSEAVVGREARRYPMQWLLDHTLLRQGRKGKSPENGEKGEEDEEEEGCVWEKVKSHDSVWFRLAEGLRYPIELQDMRYQMHLYRARSRSSTD